ncbi:LuxR C-terminal-related transcriptional regulator [Clostridium celatum]|uniref:LuxR C-terminal-related transcriptional regulator n=1 Tax=Clostridium celatum TaxID=36834 RepID=UPI00189960D7|nr:LuxR C-terminal-related transcriptional regulator [Clostridium celatum]
MQKNKHNLIKRAEERKLIRLVDANRVNDAEQEIETLHNENGFIIFALKDCKWQQWSYKKEDINNIFLQNLLGFNKDTYISMNSFKSPKRLISNLFGLNALWSDLDYYNTKYKGKSYDEMIEILSHNKLIKKIPPSLYIYSGNGMYPIWLLESAYAKACLPIWKKLMSEIHKELEVYGADPKSAEPAHVLRLAGSNNTKTGIKAKIVKESYLFKPKKYSIKELSEAILPPLEYSKEEWKALKEKKKKTKKEKASCKVKSLFNIHTLNYARMQDLQTIVELRDGQVEGLRETILFLYRYWGNCFWKDNQRALEECLEFNKIFTEPLEEKEVKEATKRAEVAAEIWEEKLKEYWELENKPSVYNFFKGTGCYVYSNKTLIELLKITQEEMKCEKLNTMFNTKEKNRRNKEYRNEWNKAQRRNKNGLTSREQAKQDKINAILDFIDDGLTNKQMAIKLECSEKTIEYYKKQIKDKQITKVSKKVEDKPIIELERITDNELKLMVI